MALWDASLTTRSLSMSAWNDNYGLGAALGAGKPAAWGTTLSTDTRYVNAFFVQGEDSGIRAAWGGSGLSYSAPSLSNQLYQVSLVGGVLTSFALFDTNGDFIYSLTGFSHTIAAGSGEPGSMAPLFAGDDTLRSGSGDDFLDGFAGNDSIVGGSGNDTLVAGAGDDTLDGGAGLDTVTFAAASAGIVAVFGNTNGASVTGGAGNDVLLNLETVAGSAYADRIEGHASAAVANLFVGGAGNDTLSGGAGHDTLQGGAGADSLAGGVGTDTVRYDDPAIGAVTLDMLSGVATVDEGQLLSETASSFENFIGSQGADKVTGTLGANELDGREGDDWLNGGSGNDSLLGGLGQDTLVGSAGDDSLLGGSGGDVLMGGAGNDLLTEDHGDGSIDEFLGGAGDDTYRVGTGTRAGDPVTSGYDVVQEAADGGNDTVWLRVGAMGYVLPAYVENVVMEGGGGSVLGNELDNLIDGRAFYNYQGRRLYGAAGQDTLWGGQNSDTLDGGSGDDTMSGGWGEDLYFVDSLGDLVQEVSSTYEVEYDTVVACVDGVTLATGVEHLRLEAFSDAFSATGNAASNTMWGNESNNKLSGLGNSDQLYGGAGNDTLLGGSGHDWLGGGTGDDLLDGGVGLDTVSYAGLGVKITVNLNTTTAQATGAGSDTLVGIENVTGGAVGDALYGNTGDNSLSGLGGDDTLKGGSGNDSLSGGDGDDLLYGGSGSDQLSGGAGSDVFVLDYKGTGQRDTISDFVSGTDRIAVSMAAFGVGDKDTVIDGAQAWSTSGGYSKDAELVVFTQRMGSNWNTADAIAAAIGSASSAYAAGDTRLFVVKGGYYSGENQSFVYLFTSSGADAAVSGSELQLIAWLPVFGPSEGTQVSDYLFTA